jgi:hypothetical protein
MNYKHKNNREEVIKPLMVLKIILEEKSSPWNCILNVINISINY